MPKTMLSAVLMLVLAGCSTTCRFDTNAPGARLYLDGVLRGVMPCDVELKDDQGSYTARAEHENYETLTCMISQQYAGTVTNQQSSTNVNATTNAYGVGRGATSNTYGTINENTQTQQYAAYAWPTRFFVTLAPKQGAPAPAPTPTTVPQSTSNPAQNAPSSPAAFCPKCGKAFGEGAQFCAGCGARR